MTLCADTIKSIFGAAVDSVRPGLLIKETLQIDNGKIRVCVSGGSITKVFDLNHNVYVVAFGKAACGMARATEDVLKQHIVKGIASIPFGTLKFLEENHLEDLMPPRDSKIIYCEGAALNLPDDMAYETSLKILDFISKLAANDLLIVLISGGGSALLTCPPRLVPLADKLTVVKMLSSRGATITQLNTFRQHVSLLKGGKLALAAKPARVISLIISDVVGNPLSVIGSGPTAPCETDAEDALKILRSFCVDEEIPRSVLLHLTSQVAKRDIYGIESISYDHVTNILLGSNSRALSFAKHKAQSCGFDSFVVRQDLSGDASDVGQRLADLLLLIITYAYKAHFSEPSTIEERFGSLLPANKEDKKNLDAFLCTNISNLKPFCMLWGGETTVVVKGHGKGGRNQEMVLSFLSHLASLQSRNSNNTLSGWDFCFASAGTDGQDGPTDSAGAVVSKSDLVFLLQEDHDEKFGFDFARNCLSNNDSYSFFQHFRQGQCHLKCGFTGTNVMDLQILLVSPL